MALAVSIVLLDNIEWPTPVLACADLGGHVVDLWIAPASQGGHWCCANDDRSVCGTGADADEALDAYLRALELEREVLGDDDVPGEADDMAAFNEERAGCFGDDEEQN